MTGINTEKTDVTGQCCLPAADDLLSRQTQNPALRIQTDNNLISVRTVAVPVPLH